jgi:hypothetical protein
MHKVQWALEAEQLHIVEEQLLVAVQAGQLQKMILR